MKEMFRKKIHNFLLPDASELLLDGSACRTAIERSGGRFGRIPQSTSTMVLSYITWGMKNRPVGGRSSETWSHSSN
jgi:hypothetical protein